jgi:hypothetical protein
LCVTGTVPTGRYRTGRERAQKLRPAKTFNLRHF